MNDFQINSDLLDLVSWMVYQVVGPEGEVAGVRWLRRVFEAHQELKADQSELEDHIVWSAAEYLLWGEREAIMAYALGKASLLPSFQQSLNKKGFMIGDKFPQAVQRWIDVRAKVVYDLDVGHDQP